MTKSSQMARTFHRSSLAMAGHSHWANIQHHKGKKDTQRAQMFAKAAKEITICARLGKSGNVQENPRLATAVQKARAMNFPRERIEAAIDKGLGRNQGALDYSTYEFHGPLKVAFVVDTASDSKNRIISHLRTWATRRGGSMANNGTFAFLFQKHGIVELSMVDKTEDQIMEAVINAGAEDVSFDEEAKIATVECKPDEDLVWELRNKFEEAGIEVLNSEVQTIPTTTVTISGEEDIALFKSSLTALEEIEGVEGFTHNAIIEEDEEVE